MIRRALAAHRARKALRAYYSAALDAIRAETAATTARTAELAALARHLPPAPASAFDFAQAHNDRVRAHDLRAHIDHHDPDVYAEVPDCHACTVRPGGAA